MTLSRRPQSDFWRGQRVLVTGHTGFKGAWLSLWLRRMGAQVTGLALQPATQPDLFDALDLSSEVDHHVIDLRDAKALADCVVRCQPQFVFHLAAQALVRESYVNPVATWASNLMGTVHLLEALRGQRSVRAAVLITTDKVYRDTQLQRAYVEGDELGGHDPYSASKAACELAIASYRSAFLAQQGLPVASARAGNVIGGGDWAADRLVPDAVRAWTQNRPLEIRRPEAVRPWQHVLDPLAGYLVLAEELARDATLARPWNLGPPADDVATVRQVMDRALAVWPEGKVHYAQQVSGPHETHHLALDAGAARRSLGVGTRWPLDIAVQHTMQWYRDWYAGQAAQALCARDIEAWEAAE